MNEQDIYRLTNALKTTADLMNKQISPEATALMVRVLSKYPIGDVLKALTAHVENSPFWPTPADLIARVKNDGKSLKESNAEADRAWFNVRHAMQRVGPYQHVRFEDSAIAPAIRSAGGWGHCCNSSDMAETERRFKDAYAPAITDGGMLRGQNQFSQDPVMIPLAAIPVAHQIPDEEQKDFQMAPEVAKVIQKAIK